MKIASFEIAILILMRLTLHPYILHFLRLGSLAPWRTTLKSFTDSRCHDGNWLCLAECVIILHVRTYCNIKKRCVYAKYAIYLYRAKQWQWMQNQFSSLAQSVQICVLYVKMNKVIISPIGKYLVLLACLCFEFYDNVPLVNWQ